MTLLLVDGFDDGLANKGHWTLEGSGWGTGTGRSGSGLASYDSHTLQLKPADETDTLIVGLAYLWTGADNTIPLRMYSDGGATFHMYFTVRSSGQVEAHRSDGTLLGTSTFATPLVPSTWTYLEFKVKLHDTTGTVAVRANEVTGLNLTGQDTKQGGTKTTWDRVVVNLNGDQRADDVYIANNAGSVNNDFIGDIVVETLLPTGNGNLSQLVGSDGNSVDNYALVNELAASSANYVGSATSGQKDTYAFADLVHTAGTIVGVQTSLYAAKSDAGARSARSVIRSAAADYAGADVALSTTYTTYDEVWETNPATSAAWTIAGVNAAEFGFEART